jgi:hypothetical protein
MLRPRGEEPIRFLVLARHQVVHQNTQIGLVPTQAQAFPTEHFRRGVHARDQSQTGRLLVPGGAEELARQIEPLHRNGPKIVTDASWAHHVVLHRIAVPEELGPLESGNRPHHGLLDVPRQGGGHPVDVQTRAPLGLWFEEHGVFPMVGEAHHLVLDGRTVAWPDSFDLPREQGRPLEIRRDDVLHCLRSPADPAHHPVADLPGAPGKRPRLGIALLHPKPRVVDAVPVQSWRRASLESEQLQAQRTQRIPESAAGPLTEAASLRPFLAGVEDPPEKRPGGQDRRPPGHHRAVAQNHSGHALAGRVPGPRLPPRSP